jgi:hypothetical protein
MASQERVVYEGRLEGSVDQLEAALESDLGWYRLDGNGDVVTQPLADAGLCAFTYARGISREGASRLDGDLAATLAAPEVGRLYLRRFWQGDRWIITGQRYGSLEPFSLFEYNCGYVELGRSSRSSPQPGTDVTIVCTWDQFQPYREWVAGNLRERFRERAKGGPEPTPRHKRLEIVRAIRNRGDATLDEACMTSGITANTYRTWEREFEDSGEIPKRKRK